LYDFVRLWGAANAGISFGGISFVNKADNTLECRHQDFRRDDETKQWGAVSGGESAAPFSRTNDVPNIVVPNSDMHNIGADRSCPR
jgi:hypothetical protein